MSEARSAIVERALEAEANPYLMDNFGPVATECDDDGLEVIGEVPPDIDGLYVRNGPNPRYAPKGLYHWFDGDGMLHAVRIRDGRVRYRNRWIRTEALGAEVDAGTALWSGIRNSLRHNPTAMPLKDTANTDVVYHRDRLLATWYLSGQPYGIDPETLETLGKEDFGGTLRTRVSAHCKVDERTGELLFFDYGLRPPYLTYGVVGPEGRVDHLVPIDIPGPSLPHDMAITERYAILMDPSMVQDPGALRLGRNKLVFDRERPIRFGVMPRRGAADTVRWFEASPCYIYHTINAWEDGDAVVLDACRIADPAPSGAAEGTLEKMLSYLQLDARLWRYRFDLTTGECSEQMLDDANTDFPTLDGARLGLRARYAYNVHIDRTRALLFDGLVKYDLEEGRSDTVLFGPDRYGSEAPFVPRSGATAEDDGYLLSFVYDRREDRSELVIYDAREPTVGPRARVILPQPVPYGFHACWVSGARLS